MLLSLSMAGFVLSAILLIFNARKFTSSIYLGLFFLFTSLYGLYQYILLYSKSVTLISLFLVNLSIDSSPVYLIGPMLYWYTRTVLTDNPKLKRKDIWHFVPMIIFFIAAFPYSFVPWSEKVDAAMRAAEDPGFLQVYKATLLSWILPPVFIYLSRPLLVLGYTLWSIGMFINFLKKKMVSSVMSKQHFMKKWLCLLLGLLLILVVSQLLLIIKAFEMHFSPLYFTLNIARVFSIAGLIGLLISPFFFPSILYGLPRFPETVRKEVTEDSESHLPEQQKETNKLNFETEYLYLIGQKVSSSMKELQPYLHPDCNLAYFSKLIKIPAHHLAYYFREVKKQHFNDYRNEWRINHAKNLIKEGKASEMTLEAIGMLSGFSSRNAFINDFKRIEGVPPGAFASRFN